MPIYRALVTASMFLALTVPVAALPCLPEDGFSPFVQEVSTSTVGEINHSYYSGEEEREWATIPATPLVEPESQSESFGEPSATAFDSVASNPVVVSDDPWARLQEQINEFPGLERGGSLASALPEDSNFDLTDVPEPSSVLLLTLGLGIAYTSRRWMAG